MAIEARFLAFVHHILFRIVSTSPSLGGIDINVLRTTKTMHRVIHLNAFPTMIVVVFVKHEVHRLPTGSEERVVTLVVRHVQEFINLAPVVPLKTIIEAWITFQGWI